MVMTYANLQDRIEQILQDASNATYDTTELGMWIEAALKEFSQYDPHIVPVVFQIESRFGADTAGTASSLTDTTKSQFLAADATDEKVIHNTTDDTWAVVLTRTSTSVMTLSADIMDIGEGYEIFNKRCFNERQIYIGDVTDYLWIDSVEYPIGVKRSWRVYNDVLEIMVNSVGDSNSILDPPNQVDVLVRFAKPHKLCQLGTLAGAVNLSAGYVKGTKTMALDGLGSTETIEANDEFYLANKRFIYTITTGVTLSSGAGNVTFFPGVEDAVVNDDVITFTGSTLKPQHEALFCRMVAARAILSDATARINAINKGGASTYQKMVNWADGEFEKIEKAFQRNSVPITKRILPRD